MFLFILPSVFKSVGCEPDSRQRRKQNAIVLVKILNQKPRYKATAGQLRNRKVYALGLSKVINSLERDKELVPQCAKADSKESAFKGVNDRTNKKLYDLPVFWFIYIICYV